MGWSVHSPSSCGMSMTCTKFPASALHHYLPIGVCDWTWHVETPESESGFWSRILGYKLATNAVPEPDWVPGHFSEWQGKDNLVLLVLNICWELLMAVWGLQGEPTLECSHYPSRQEEKWNRTPKGWAAGSELVWANPHWQLSCELTDFLPCLNLIEPHFLLLVVLT
jgi:hypothetical protein